MGMLYDNSITLGGSSLFPTGKRPLSPSHTVQKKKSPAPRILRKEQRPRKIIDRSMSRGLMILNRKRCQAGRYVARCQKQSGQPGLRGAGRFRFGGVRLLAY